MPANVVTLTLTTVNDCKNKLTFNTWHMCLSNTCINLCNKNNRTHVHHTLIEVFTLQILVVCCTLLLVS